MTTTWFVQIFVINRLLFLYPKCRDVSLLFNDDESEQKQQATKVMASLIKMPINKYIVKNYKNNESTIVSLLYTKMMKKYPNEYETIISFYKNCVPNSNIKECRYYESKVFNQSDLVPQIFQYLSLNDLNNCCLVNSIWLYHGYDVNALYYLNLSQLVKCQHKIDQLSSKLEMIQAHSQEQDDNKYNNECNETTDNETSPLATAAPTTTTTTTTTTMKQKEKETEYLLQLLQSSFGRCLQRVVKVKNIHYDGWNGGAVMMRDSFIEMYKSLNLHNLESIGMTIKFGQYIKGSEKEFIKEICTHVSNVKIFVLRLCVISNRVQQIPKDMTPVYLTKAEKVELEGLLIPIILTNKCKLLKLAALPMIDYFWCDRMIKKSDLTNIEMLRLDNIGFNFASINDSEKKNILNKFALKMVNLKYLDIRKVNEDELKFWQALKPVIIKNNTLIGLSISHDKFVDRLQAFISINNFCPNLRYLQLHVQDKACSLYKQLLLTKGVDSSIEQLHIRPFDADGFVHLFRLPQVGDSFGIEQRSSKSDSGGGDENKPTSNQEKFDYNFESLMAIEIPCTYGNFTLKIVNDFLNCQSLRNYNSKFENKNGKKQVLFWNLRFDIGFDIDKHYNNFEKNISNEFENELLRLFKTVYKMIEKEIALDIQIVLHKKIDSIVGEAFRPRHPWIFGDNYEDTPQSIAKKVETLFNKYKEKYFDVTFKSIVGNRHHGNKDLDNYNVIDWEKVKIPKCNKYCQTTNTPKIEFELQDYIKQHNDQSFKIKLMDFRVQTARKRNDSRSFAT